MMIREGDADKLHDRMRRLDSLFCLGRQAVWVSTEQPNTVAWHLFRSISVHYTQTCAPAFTQKFSEQSRSINSLRMT